MPHKVYLLNFLKPPFTKTDKTQANGSAPRLERFSPKEQRNQLPFMQPTTVALFFHPCYTPCGDNIE